MKSFFKSVGIAILGGAVVLGSYKMFFEQPQSKLSLSNDAQTSKLPVQQVGYTGSAPINTVDFTEAAERTIHAVVHVKNTTLAKGAVSMADLMYGRTPYREAVGTGSGVIITQDGYIVTNNHVIAKSTNLEVTLNNNKSYPAKLVGTDEKSDIALLKIETDEELPYMTFGDSNQVKIGEWVLAVGNPFNLNSTVTAGIISAKGRDLQGDSSQIQSFLQTDAAVNPGNSGGALVNTRGELIGINTAIASRTGSYVGYSFAVPSNNARKIIEDIMEYGFVQKGMLGISGRDLNGKLAGELGIKEAEGIYVGSVLEASGAAKAGVRVGDIITKINGIKIRNFADLTGFVNSKNPGDVVMAVVMRDGNAKQIKIEITKNNTVSVPQLEMDLRDLNAQDKKIYGTKAGVKVERTTGSLARYDMRDYVIIAINDNKVTDIVQLKSILRNIGAGETVLIEMKNTRDEVERFRYTID
jgi:Do/DeqQ family serine protease